MVAMVSVWFSSCSFQVSAFRRAQPAIFAFLVAVCIIAFVTGLAYMVEMRQLDSVQQEVHRLRSSLAPAAAPVQAENSAAMDLPRFEGGALVDTLYQVSTDVGLPLDEISYSMEGGPDQPYLRYRVTLSVTSNYPRVRKFVDELGMNLSNATLDSISCAREDIAQSALKCDLAFSMFYRKEARG